MSWLSYKDPKESASLGAWLGSPTGAFSQELLAGMAQEQSPPITHPGHLFNLHASSSKPGSVLPQVGYHRNGTYKADVNTPTIDGLVKEGVELNRHYVVRLVLSLLQPRVSFSPFSFHDAREAAQATPLRDQDPTPLQLPTALFSPCPSCSTSSLPLVAHDVHAHARVLPVWPSACARPPGAFLHGACQADLASAALPVSPFPQPVCRSHCQGLASPCQPDVMPRNMTGIAEHMKAGGYATHFVGKVRTLRKRATRATTLNVRDSPPRAHVPSLPPPPPPPPFPVGRRHGHAHAHAQGPRLRHVAQLLWPRCGLNSSRPRTGSEHTLPPSSASAILPPSGNWMWSEAEWQGSYDHRPDLPPCDEPDCFKDFWDTDK